MAQAFLLEAIARDALGDTPAADRALEHALDLSEPDGNLLPFLLHPARALLERHRRGRTAHRMLVSQILHLLAQAAPTEPDTQGGLARPPGNLGPGITAVRRGSERGRRGRRRHCAPPGANAVLPLASG